MHVVKMVSTRPDLIVIAGGGRKEKIALSLVHVSGQIDVPVEAINWIEARENLVFSVRGAPRSIRSPRVELSLRFDIRARLLRLTQKIVGQPLEVIVASRSISKPIVREPIGRRATFAISVVDFDDAQVLAAELRARCGITRPRTAP